ncbi:MAG: hypothetical protein V4650_13210 [Pseudomonadota bacterium]
MKQTQKNTQSVVANSLLLRLRQLPVRHLLPAAGLLSTALFSACASFAVTDQKLQQNTAFALGLEKEDFTISDRFDEGLKTTYTTKTAAGKQYNCYVMGTVGVTGRNVSDAMCNEKGKAATNPLTGR